MPKRSETVSVDPASSEIQRQTGLRLRHVRELAGLTQTQICDVLGVDQSQWSRWERGLRMPDELVMIRFAAHAQTSLDLIYRGIPIGTNPVLRKLLMTTVPELLVPDPIDTDQDRDTALSSYRSAILQPQE